LHRKTVTNWRQLIKLPTFEFCSASKIASTLIPFVATQLEFVRNNFKTLPIDCPLLPGKYSGNNTYTDMHGFHATTTISPRGIGISMPTPKTETWLSLPNGIYRHDLLLSTKNDPDAFHMIWVLKRRDRLGIDEF
jgi:hypothetical protein